MKRADWLCLVAVHADCWLMAMTFYNGAKLDQKGRQRLFEEINSLPTVYEIVSGRAAGKPSLEAELAAKRARAVRPPAAAAALPVTAEVVLQAAASCRCSCAGVVYRPLLPDARAASM